MGPITPHYQEALEQKKVDSRNCFCTPAGNNKYVVLCGGSQRSVDLSSQTCTCRMWQLSGLPCKHAVAAIFSNREEPKKYMHQYFSKATFLNVFKNLYNPLPSQEEWETTPYPNIHPWVVRKPPGRPKKKRVRAPDEPRNPYKCLRAGGYVTCGKCEQKGHNARGCRADITGETASQARKRKQALRIQFLRYLLCILMFDLIYFG